MKNADLPVFGNRIDSQAYVRRPSAYALVRNAESQLAVVRTPNGCFLPGGGMELDETPQQTVVREAMEECGFVLKPGRVMERAIQFVYSTAEKKYFEKICEFMQAELISTAAPSELDHEVMWLSEDQARACLSHESHCWAVSRADGRVS
jgi:8-oxo-dGTP diphosphatase